MTLIKVKTLDGSYEGHGPLISEYEEATHSNKPNIYDDATDDVIPNTVPPFSSKTNTKDALPSQKAKKSKIGKLKLTNTPDPTKKPIPLSISNPVPASK